MVQLVTSVEVVNNTAKTIDVTVPANQEWMIQHIKIVNPDDVSRVTTIIAYIEAAKTNILAELMSLTMTTLQTIYWAHNELTTSATKLIEMTSQMPLTLIAGNTISFVWASGGASTGATDADGLVVAYRRIGA